MKPAKTGSFRTVVLSPGSTPLRGPHGALELNYRWRADKRFLSHFVPAMQRMAALLRSGRVPAEIMH